MARKADWLKNSPVECATGVKASRALGRVGGWLEDDFQSKLHIESLSGADARSAVEVADGVGSDADSAAVRAARRSKVRAVEEVEHLDAELRSEALRDLGVLHDREVHRAIAWSVVPVARTSSQRSGSRIGKSRGIDPAYTALGEGARHASVGIAHLVRTLFAFEGA